MTHLVVLSGGLDSTTALAVARVEKPDHEPVVTVSIDYGQRHRRELDRARAISQHYDVPHRVLDMRGLLHGSALLGAGEVPEGHYAHDTMTATVVHGRNLLFVSAAVAATRPGDTLWMGVHAGDHPIYPDCRPEFWQAAHGMVTQAYEVGIRTPFVHATKADVVATGHALDAPLHLTWSCYVGDDRHCGRCGTCVERAEAFALAGISDPTDYADPNYWRTVVAS